MRNASRAPIADLGVVVPTRNSARTLEWTLLSLKYQEQTPTEIVVADSASTDGTLEICAAHSVRVIQVPPGNMYTAINRGLETLRSEWMMYLNSDDLFYSDASVRLIAHGEASGAEVVYGFCDFVDRVGRFLYRLVPSRTGDLGAIFARGIFPLAQPATIFRRAVFERLGGFQERFHYSADYEFFARAHRCGSRFARLGPPSTAAFRVHGDQLTAAHEAEIEREKRTIAAEQAHAGALAGMAAELRWRIENVPELVLSLARTRRIRRRVFGSPPA